MQRLNLVGYHQDQNSLSTGCLYNFEIYSQGWVCVKARALLLRPRSVSESVVCFHRSREEVKYQFVMFDQSKQIVFGHIQVQESKCVEVHRDVRGRL